MNEIVEQFAKKLKTIETINDILEEFDFVKDLRYERLYAFGVNIKGEVVYQEVISDTYDEDEAGFSPQELFRDVLKADSVYLYLMHNHPSGASNPSMDDIETTRNIANGCRYVGMIMKDHVIIANDGYYSFSEHNFKF